VSFAACWVRSRSPSSVRFRRSPKAELTTRGATPAVLIVPFWISPPCRPQRPHTAFRFRVPPPGSHSPGTPPSHRCP
jgi:hypothetical protein